MSELSIELPCGLAQVALADDVVAIEHRPRFVARDHHRDALGDPAPDHVAHSRPAEIVEQQARYFRSCADFRPGAAEIADRLTVFTSKNVIVGLLADDALLQKPEDQIRHHRRTALIVLGLAGFEADRAGRQIDLSNAKVKQLTLAPTEAVCDLEHCPKPQAFSCTLFREGVVLPVFDEPFADVALL